LMVFTHCLSPKQKETPRVAPMKRETKPRVTEKTAVEIAIDPTPKRELKAKATTRDLKEAKVLLDELAQ